MLSCELHKVLEGAALLAVGKQFDISGLSQEHY